MKKNRVYIVIGWVVLVSAVYTNALEMQLGELAMRLRDLAGLLPAGGGTPPGGGDLGPEAMVPNFTGRDIIAQSGNITQIGIPAAVDPALTGPVSGYMATYYGLAELARARGKIIALPYETFGNNAIDIIKKRRIYEACKNLVFNRLTSFLIVNKEKQSLIAEGLTGDALNKRLNQFFAAIPVEEKILKLLKKEIDEESIVADVNENFAGTPEEKQAEIVRRKVIFRKKHLNAFYIRLFDGISKQIAEKFVKTKYMEATNTFEFPNDVHYTADELKALLKQLCVDAETYYKYVEGKRELRDQAFLKIVDAEIDHFIQFENINFDSVQVLAQLHARYPEEGNDAAQMPQGLGLQSKEIEYLYENRHLLSLVGLNKDVIDKSGELIISTYDNAQTIKQALEAERATYISALGVEAILHLKAEAEEAFNAKYTGQMHIFVVNIPIFVTVGENVEPRSFWTMIARYANGSYVIIDGRNDFAITEPVVHQLQEFFGDH